MLTDGEIANRYLERGFPEAAYVWANQSNEHSASMYSALGTAIFRCFGFRRVDDAIKAYTKAIIQNRREDKSFLNIEDMAIELRLLRGEAYLMKVEDLRDNYLGHKTGVPHKSEELMEMLIKAAAFAGRDFLSAFRLSRSSGGRGAAARKIGELYHLRTSITEGLEADF